MPGGLRDPERRSGVFLKVASCHRDRQQQQRTAATNNNSNSNNNNEQ
jgi:hypothetical protein